MAKVGARRFAPFWIAIAFMKLTVLNVAYPFAPVGPDAVGGAEQVLTALDSALVWHGHRSLVAACEGSRVSGELVAELPRCANLSSEACARIRALHRTKVQNVIARAQIDLIHLHGVDFVEYLPETNIPVLVTLHLPPSFYSAAVFNSLPDNYTLQCVSFAQANECLCELLPVIENGVDLQKFTPGSRKYSFALGLGRICPEKGFHHAIAAAKRADIPLLIGGESFAYETHQRYFQNEFLPQLDHQRRWAGPLGFDRKRRLLSAARCLLVPSLVAETSSLVSMEALASGTPVIAFPNGALPKIIEHGKTGFLVKNAEEMAEAIRQADLIDPEECRRAACQRFALERMVSQYLDLYQSLAHGKKRSSESAEELCVA
jgi:glycosyltransferase involved in cell wall biosynthesis